MELGFVFEDSVAFSVVDIPDGDGFFFLVPVTLKYSHDLHAKKNTLLIRTAICFENSSLGLHG